MKWMGTIAILSALCPALSAAVRAQERDEVVYDHFKECPAVASERDGCTVGYTVAVEPGGTLTIWVKRTDPQHFDYVVHGYTARVIAGRRGALNTATDKSTPSDSIAIELTHNSRFGGYVVTISPKPALQDTTTLRLGAAVVVVTVPGEEKPYAFSGGISLTNVRSESFVARPAGTDEYTVDVDDARRDAASVGFATFINVTLAKTGLLARLWPGIGIGLESAGHTQYYFGAGVRLQKGIFFNTGAVLGRVAALPSGIQIADTISDPNRLADLSSRSKFGFFVGLSFSFLGGGQQEFQKPFAGTERK